MARDFLDPADLISGVLSEHFSVPLAMRCSEWADTWRIIAKGPEKGQWRTSRTPYLAEIMDCTDPEHQVSKVVLQFATQMGKSEVLYNAILKRIHISPMDMMFLQPTLQDAKDHSSQRFTQTIKVMPHVMERVAEVRSRDETNTLFTKEIANGAATLFFSGANSARSLASKPIGFVACDEIDGYPGDVDNEGDPIGLVSERMSNFPGRKLILCSTPTTRGFSAIERDYLDSDQRLYHVPCPHCGERQVLVWGTETEFGLKWLKTEGGLARPETAVYICRHCGAAIQEYQKTEMLAGGLWVPEKPGAQNGSVAGFKLNKLYSPVGWKSWEMLVQDWLSAVEMARSGDKSKIKRFTNTSLAETYEEDGDRSDIHMLRRRAADIELGTVAYGHFVRTLGVDVQGDRLEVYDWAWGRGMARQLVNRVVIYGDPAAPENETGSPWEKLTEYRTTDVMHASGLVVPLLAVLIDSGGHHTQAVYHYARTHQTEAVLAGKGSSQSGKAIIGKPTNQDVNWRGQRFKSGVKLWPIGTDTAKAEIYGRLRIGEPGLGFVLLSKHLHPDVFDQLTSEKMVTRHVKGRPRLEWVLPAGRRNEGLDCAVYGLAAAHWLGMDRWREGDWSKWQSKVESVAASVPRETKQRRMRGTIGPRRNA